MPPAEATPTASRVVGGWLVDKPRDVLYGLARSANMWERRTAIVATSWFLRTGEVKDTFAIAELLLDDTEDLIHKATGGWLRDAGRSDRPRLLEFLDAPAALCPERYILGLIRSHPGRHCAM
ncbi:3-methyladenine DNA glycosylase AlkD [Arthrobacter pascens]|uniref:DNA alkylation repair protein n=1 Tax=Arthrobacter pascens TaxID=1677 RepID=UPI002790B4DA|nr:DNA alkylation repair protein [Arthrobacter pascens]MDQ0677376.1 3-methyladenine DNA glycosylase AlkD [Arthrobacter pascens]